jgi:alkaline phosphatase
VGSPGFEAAGNANDVSSKEDISMKLASRRHRALVSGGVAAAVLASAVAAVATGSSGAPDRSAGLTAQIDPDKPRNVILLIGDGTDESIITAARNYEKGADGAFAIDKLPFVGDMTTHGLKVGAGPDYPIAYVSDSAPTASAWSTGHKTVDGRLSQGPSTADTVPGQDFRTVLMDWRDSGRRTGNVSTAEITDATPAAAASNINARACQGPSDMASCVAARKANGGKGSVAEQLVDNRVDVILGGGLNRFNQATDAGPSVLDYARNSKGYRYVANATELDDVGSLGNKRLLGLFAGGNMTPRYSPLVATPPPGAGGPTARCSLANRGTQPSLGAMTEKAIDLLENRKGFFLQVESAMVDKQEHAADICGAIGDVSELDDALKVALAFKRHNPDTLIVVTSDHAHSTQIVPNGSSGRQTATLLTADGDPMSVAYSTQAVGSSHTGSTVRVAATGPQAANVTGLIDQTDLYWTLKGHKPSKLKGHWHDD